MEKEDLEERDRFTFYISFFNAIERCPDAELRAYMYSIICKYAFFGIEPEITDYAVGMFWDGIKPNLARMRTNFANAKKGGAPKGNQNARKPQPLQGKEAEPPTNKENEVKQPQPKAKPVRPTFTPPTVGDVAEYCRSRNNGIDPEQFCDYYKANGWVQGKGKPLRDWKAAVRTWERNGIRQPQPQQTNTPKLGSERIKRPLKSTL